MAASQSIRNRRRKRNDATVKLNLASMIDMFTLLVVFLLQNYSSQGQLVTPAQGLNLPKSSVEKAAGEALSVKVSVITKVVGNVKVPVSGTIMVEKDPVPAVNEKQFAALLQQQDFLIPDLFTVLEGYAKKSKETSVKLKQEFSGRISIQGDEEIPYNILTRVMYTCGQAGFPNMDLVVYRK